MKLAKLVGGAAIVVCTAAVPATGAFAVNESGHSATTCADPSGNPGLNPGQSLQSLGVAGPDRVRTPREHFVEFLGLPSVGKAVQTFCTNPSDVHP
jgi:hypothetical protein